MEEKVQALEISMAKLEKDIGFIKSVQVENKEQNSKEHREIIGKIDDFIIACDNKYADKWVERILIWSATIVGGVILTGLIYLIYQTAVHFN